MSFNANEKSKSIRTVNYYLENFSYTTLTDLTLL